MVISGALMSLIAALIFLFRNLNSLSFTMLLMENVSLSLIIIFSAASLFSRCHPSFGVFIAFLSLCVLTRSVGMLERSMSTLSALGGFLIVLKAHDNYIEKKKEHYEEKLKGGLV